MASLAANAGDSVRAVRPESDAHARPGEER